MNLKKLLALSLLFNLLTLSAVLYLAQRPTAPPEPVAPSPMSPPTRAATGPPLTRTVVQEFDWRAVESHDYRQYIENLRGIGCPEETIQDIIIADVDKLYRARRLELLAQEDDDFKFWQTGQNLLAPADSTRVEAEMEQLRALALERRALIQELLGVDLPGLDPLIPATLNAHERLLAFLPSEKRREVSAIEQKYSALRIAALNEPGTAAERVARGRQLESEEQAELARLLTPLELEEYELRTSPVASTLRMQLHGFDPTEEEFRAIFQVRKKFEDQFGSLTALAADPAMIEPRGQARLAMEEELESILGRPRYLEMHREQDWGYRGALEVAQQAGLPVEVARRVYEIKMAAEQQSRILQVDHSRTPTERHQALVQVQRQVEQELAETFGREAYTAYRQQPGASWIYQINPAPR